MLAAIIIVGLITINLVVSAAKTKPQCSDGLDNDGDTKIDMKDLGCSNPQDNDESNCGDAVCTGAETYLTCPADCKRPNSCSDSDSGNVPTVFGTTSGYLSGSAYSHSDTCIDASNIIEFYCSGTQSVSQQQSCGADSSVDICLNGSVYTQSVDNFCGTGRCQQSATTTLKQACSFGCTNGVCNPPQDSCSDSDGGNVPAVYGTASGFLGGNAYSNSDYCVGTGSVLEYFCNGNYMTSQQQACSSGCSSGACLTATPSSCTDSDGGANIYVKGTTADARETQVDACSSSTRILEHICTPDGLGGQYVLGEYFDCPAGYVCSDGACVNQLQSSGCAVNLTGGNGVPAYWNGDLMSFYWQGDIASYTIKTLNISGSVLKVGATLTIKDRFYNSVVYSNTFPATSSGVIQANVLIDPAVFNPGRNVMKYYDVEAASELAQCGHGSSELRVSGPVIADCALGQQGTIISGSSYTYKQFGKFYYITLNSMSSITVNSQTFAAVIGNTTLADGTKLNLLSSVATNPPGYSFCLSQS